VPSSLFPQGRRLTCGRETPVSAKRSTPCNALAVPALAGVALILFGIRHCSRARTEKTDCEALRAPWSEAVEGLHAGCTADNCVKVDEVPTFSTPCQRTRETEPPFHWPMPGEARVRRRPGSIGRPPSAFPARDVAGSGRHTIFRSSCDAGNRLAEGNNRSLCTRQTTVRVAYAYS